MRLSRLPFGVTVLASLVVLFTPASGVPSAPPGTDKIVHGLLFAALAVTGSAAGISTPRLLVGLVGYAGLSEVLQGVLPLDRSADTVDAGFDMLGIGCGWALTAWARRVRKARSVNAARQPRRGRRTTG